MEYLWEIHYDYTWAGLLVLAVRCGVLYLLLRGGEWWLRRRRDRGSWWVQGYNWIHYALLFFEPLLLLVVSSYFILIQPFYHGLIILLVLLLNFRHLRNYFSGRILLLDRGITVGQRFAIDTEQGIISNTGRLGLLFQTSRGTRFLDYNQILKQGYTLPRSQDNQGFFRLQVATEDDAGKRVNEDRLRTALQVVPYLNWRHGVQIKPVDNSNNTWLVSLSLFDEQHLPHLQEALQERDFQCTLAKL